MNARQLVNELRCEGVELEASGGQIMVRGDREAFTPTMRAKVIALKPELLALLEPTGSMSDAEYQRAALESHRKYVSHLARAYGYDDAAIALACQWLALCPRTRTFHVGRRRIRIDLATGVAAYLRHPSEQAPRGAAMDP